MGHPGQIIPFYGNINWAANICAVQRLNHLTQKVKLELRMHCPNASRVIRIAMVALSKNIDRVNFAKLKRFDKCLCVKFIADCFTLQGSMKVEMYLAISVVDRFHNFLYLCPDK